MFSQLSTHTQSHSTEQSPSWEANSSAASQEIPCVSWNSEVRHSMQKSPSPPVPNPEPDQSSLCSHGSLSVLVLSSHRHLGFPSGFFPSGLPTKTLHAPLLSTHVPHVSSISLYLISSTEYRPWSPSLCRLLPSNLDSLRPKYLSQHPVLQHNEPTFLLEY